MRLRWSRENQELLQYKNSTPTGSYHEKNRLQIEHYEHENSITN